MGDRRRSAAAAFDAAAGRGAAWRGDSQNQRGHDDFSGDDAFRRGRSPGELCYVAWCMADARKVARAETSSY